MFNELILFFQLAQLKQQLAMKESLLKKVGGKAPIDVADATGQPFREHEMRRLEMEKTKGMISLICEFSESLLMLFVMQSKQ